MAQPERVVRELMFEDQPALAIEQPVSQARHGWDRIRPHERIQVPEWTKVSMVVGDDRLIDNLSPIAKV